MTNKVVVREDKQWEQIAFAEVLVPNSLNNYGDYYTAEAVRDACYKFAEKGYGLDVNHDNVDVTGTGYYVIESFIAREGDPDFIPGSWVVGIKVVDDALWQRILDGDLNGFSWEAEISLTDILVVAEENREIVGTTEPHPDDGHTHDYLIIVDVLNNPLAGATSETNGHSHTISTHTITDVADGHNHRFQVIQ